MIAPLRLPAFVLSCSVPLLWAACARADASVRDEIVATLAGNQSTSGLKISVEMRRHIVFLSGETDSVEEQQRVLDVVRVVDGVTLVVNDIVLNDRALAGRVQQALVSDAQLGGVRIAVEARGGVVRLLSDATDADQRRRAVEIASGVEGVIQVEDWMK
jgi:osmotically-inducible protein OsmY